MLFFEDFVRFGIDDSLGKPVDEDGSQGVGRMVCESEVHRVVLDDSSLVAEGSVDFDSGTYGVLVVSSAAVCIADPFDAIGKKVVVGNRSRGD